VLLAQHEGDDHVRAWPVDAIELGLAASWVAAADERATSSGVTFLRVTRACLVRLRCSGTRETVRGL
jgi:hypothetical protein